MTFIPHEQAQERSLPERRLDLSVEQTFCRYQSAPSFGATRLNQFPAGNKFCKDSHMDRLSQSLN